MKTALRTACAGAALASIAALTIALPASAVSYETEWGTWVVSEGDSLEFTNPDFVDATVTVTDALTYDVYTTDYDGEAFTEETEIGALIGSNADSSTLNYLKVETQADNEISAHVNITFDSPVPADSLALAISDIDSDNVAIYMGDVDGNALTGEEIVGVDNSGFNFCDVTTPPSACGSDTEYPSVYEEGDHAFAGDAADGTDGSSMWVRPTVAVSTIDLYISTEDGFSSAERIWLGQILPLEDAATDDELAATGVNGSLYLGAVAGASILVAGGLVALRRRQA